MQNFAFFRRWTQLARSAPDNVSYIYKFVSFFRSITKAEICVSELFKQLPHPASTYPPPGSSRTPAQVSACEQRSAVASKQRSGGTGSGDADRGARGERGTVRGKNQSQISRVGAARRQTGPVCHGCGAAGHVGAAYIWHESSLFLLLKFAPARRPGPHRRSTLLRTSSFPSRSGSISVRPCEPAHGHCAPSATASVPRTMHARPGCNGGDCTGGPRCPGK